MRGVSLGLWRAVVECVGTVGAKSGHKMDARWTKSAPEARHDGAKVAMLAATWSFWVGFGSIFGSLLNECRENGRSVETNNPPSLLVDF